MIVIELTAAIDDAGTERTFYVSDTRFVTEPTDTPANEAFEPRLTAYPDSINLTAFGTNRVGGGTRLSAGEMRLANADGALDAWNTYDFGGRRFIMRQGEEGAPYPGA